MLRMQRTHHSAQPEPRNWKSAEISAPMSSAAVAPTVASPIVCCSLLLRCTRYSAPSLCSHQPASARSARNILGLLAAQLHTVGGPASQLASLPASQPTSSFPRQRHQFVPQCTGTHRPEHTLCLSTTLSAGPLLPPELCRPCTAAG